MRFLRAVAVSWLVVSGFACIAPVAECDATNCRGCCDAAGVCQLGNDAQACGSFGGQCNACTLGLTCNAGVCVPFSSQGGGVGSTGGGAATGGGSTTGGGDGATGGGDGVTGGGTATGGGAGTGGGVANGPAIRITPTSVAFGQVPFFAGNPSPQRRTLTIENVGAGFLRLGNGGAPPHVEITGSTDFTAQLASTYDAQTGLAAGASVEVTVTFVATQLGATTATLVLRSNDASKPTVNIALSADGVAVPPCDIEVTPTTVNFGQLAPGVVKDVAITVTNRLSGAGDLCLINNVALGAGSHATFSLPLGPVPSVVLQPLEARRFIVRAWATNVSPQPVLGTLEFDVARPNANHVIIPITANVRETCLSLVPGKVDFGTVRVGCGSANRMFTLYNSCPGQVQLTNVTMLAAAGQPAGGAQCPGTQPCPEFRFAIPFNVPDGGVTLDGLDGGIAPVNFHVRYTPLDVGDDLGAVAIETRENNQTSTTLVELVGRGAALAQQTDSFSQPVTTKADVLLVVDDSCSMEDKQLALAQNFNSFIQYAVAANVDYRIGVTTTTEKTLECFSFPGFPEQCVSSNSKGPEGKLVVDTATQLKWVTPTTPQVASVFSRLVNVGTSGAGTEAPLGCAVRALTSPVLSGPNAGFLRADAQLAVVVVSDATDQSSQTVSYYQDMLVNVLGAARRSEFTFSAIGPTLMMPPSNCVYDETGANSGRYSPIVQFTGGALEEICTVNWPTLLQRLSDTTFGVRSRFTLRTIPDLSSGSLAVLINGQGVAGCGTPTGCATWSYDAATNSLQFAAAGVPPPGATVEVRYAQQCFAP